MCSRSMSLMATQMPACDKRGRTRKQVHWKGGCRSQYIPVDQLLQLLSQMHHAPTYARMHSESGLQEDCLSALALF